MNVKTKFSIEKYRWNSIISFLFVFLMLSEQIVRTNLFQHNSIEKNLWIRGFIDRLVGKTYKIYFVWFKIQREHKLVRGRKCIYL